jgi:hypothetical protein
MDERRKCRELRTEIQALRAKMAAPASINEVLLAENRQLRAASSAPGVRVIGTAKSKSPRRGGVAGLPTDNNPASRKVYADEVAREEVVANESVEPR